jgi:hypothetical protein
MFVSIDAGVVAALAFCLLVRVNSPWSGRGRFVFLNVRFVASGCTEVKIGFKLEARSNRFQLLEQSSKRGFSLLLLLLLISCLTDPLKGPTL